MAGRKRRKRSALEKAKASVVELEYELAREEAENRRKGQIIQTLDAALTALGAPSTPGDTFAHRIRCLAESKSSCLDCPLEWIKRAKHIEFFSEE